MTSHLIPFQQPLSLDEIESQARAFFSIARSANKGIKTVEDCIAMGNYSNALLVPIPIGLKEIHMIDGKPTPSVWLALGLIRRAKLPDGRPILARGPVEQWTGEGETLTCNVWTWRTDDQDPYLGSFSWQEAIQAEKTGNAQWRRYGKDMIYRNSLFRSLRRGFSDIFMGAVYDAQAEFGDKGPLQPIDIQQVDVSQDVIDVEHKIVNTKAVDFDAALKEAWNHAFYHGIDVAAEHEKYRAETGIAPKVKLTDQQKLSLTTRLRELLPDDNVF